MDTIIEFDEHGKVIAIGGEPWPPMKPIPTVTQRRRAPKLVGEPGKIVRRYTFRSLAAIAALQAAWLVWGVTPPEWLQVVTLVIALLGAFGAFVDQPETR